MRGDCRRPAYQPGALLNGEEAEPAPAIERRLEAGLRIEASTFVPHDQGELAVLDRDLEPSPASRRMEGHVPECFLSDPIEGEHTVGGAKARRHRTVDIHLEPVDPGSFVGQLLQHQPKVPVLESRGMEPMSQLAECNAQVLDLPREAREPAPLLIGDAYWVGLPHRQFVAEDGQTLDRVIVYLSRHRGPFLVLRRQQAPAIRLMEPEEAALGDDDRGSQRHQEDRQADSGRKEEGPERFAGPGHSIPQAMARNATTYEAARTW